jgi:hypothetical protein
MRIAGDFLSGRKAARAESCPPKTTAAERVADGMGSVFNSLFFFVNSNLCLFQKEHLHQTALQTQNQQPLVSAIAQTRCSVVRQFKNFV